MPARKAANRLPFTMKTVFQDLFLLTYTMPPAALNRLLPPPIHAFVHEGRSYISIVVGNMRGMRPGIIPEVFGANYYQIVYRAVVSIHDRQGKEQRGVFFLRSDSNDPVMSYFGNHFTEFRFHYFHTGAISLIERSPDSLISVQTADKGGDLVAHLVSHGAAAALPPAAGFATVAEEKDLLVQLFHAYAYDDRRRVVYDLEIERGNWDIHRLEMRDAFSAFFTETPFTPASAQPISHLSIQECSYIWKPMVAIDLDTLQTRPEAASAAG